MSLRQEEIASLRADLNSQLSDTCEIYTLTYESTGDGDNVASKSSTPRVTCQCKYIPGRAVESSQAGSVPMVTSGKVIIPALVEVDPSDVIVVNDMEFEILGVIYRSPFISRVITVARSA